MCGWKEGSLWCLKWSQGSPWFLDALSWRNYFVLPLQSSMLIQLMWSCNWWQAKLMG
uniref:Uncharacterized protein n=1 Tax=Aegilops tauschii subsp. strangulata TaxID=200361 RepID=A0A452XS10_AEGTS